VKAHVSGVATTSAYAMLGYREGTRLLFQEVGGVRELKSRGDERVDTSWSHETAA